MSSSIDTRVVEAKFDNKDFERGVQQTLRSLEALNKGLKLQGATKGLHDLNAAGSKIDLKGIANGVSTIASRFSTLGVIGVAALGSIGIKAAQVGLQMASSLTVSPLKSGLQEYETNLNSIQTILANTGLEGKAGLQQVNDALGQLNTYSDKTIYNFSQMARNIGTFTAAGVDLKTSTAAIKGIANLAAISGSNAEQASTAMYQLSQALASGRVSLMDWNSVVNAGMGGKVFQESLKETARAHGVAVDQIIKDEGSFRDSLQKGWLTSEVLTETLQKFTGDFNEAQLKTLGYNEDQIKQIMKLGKTAQDAATKVKTMSQLVSTLQEAMGSGWSRTFQILFGDFDEARNLFTGLSDTIGGFIQRNAEARNKVLGDWKALGGRKVLIDGLAIAFNNLMDIISPITKAFRDIFPPTTGRRLFDLTVKFRDLMAALRLNEGTMDNIRRTFRGVFAVLSIGISIVKGIFTALSQVFAAFKGGGSGVLEFTGNIGDMLVALDKAIKNGEGFHNFFVGLGQVIAAPIKFIKILIGFIKDLVTGAEDLGDVGLDSLAERFKPMGNLGELISRVWSRVVSILQGVFRVFQPLADAFSEFFNGLGTAISDAFADADYSSVLDSVNTGLLAGLVLLFKKFLSGGINVDLGGGVLSSIKDSFEGLTGVMTAMQAQLKANALLKIAGAIALLTASVVALSLIDSKRLSTALAGLAALFTQLLISMHIMDSIVASKGFLKMPFLTTSMIALAIAIDLLAIAVAKIAKLNWNEIAKGLTGTAVLLASLALFSRFAGASTVGSGASLILLAVGINILVNAVKDFSQLSWGDIAKGLVGVAGLLTALALFTKFQTANAGGIAQGAGLLLLALAIKVLATAMDDLGNLSWEQIGKGLVVMAGGLALMAGALNLVPPSSLLSAAAIFVTAASLKMIGDAVGQMGGLKWGEIARGLTAMAGALTLISVALALLPPSSLLSAAAIFVTAASLGMIGKALGNMGDMSWEEIGKGLVVLAGALGILAGALYLMQTTVAGSAALLLAAVSLNLLVPVLQALGAMSWGEIIKGLIGLAGAFTILGVAGLVLGVLSPIILALGVAIAAMGVGMLAAGAGMFLFGIGLTAVAAAGSAAVAILVGVVRNILTLLPEIVTALGNTITAFAKAVIKAAPAVVQAIVVVLTQFLNAIDRMAPRIVATLIRLMYLLLQTVRKNIGPMTQLGVQIIISFLNAMSRNIGKIVNVATNLVVNFLNALSRNMPRITQAGVNLIITFVNSVANAIRNNTPAIEAAGRNLGSAVISGMVAGIKGGIGAIGSAAKEAASSALNAAKGVLGIHSPSKEFEKIGKNVVLGFVKGIEGNKAQIDAAFKNLKANLVNMQKNQINLVKKLRAERVKLLASDKKDAKKIAANLAALRQAEASVRSLSAAYKLASKNFKDEQALLGKLALRYDQYSAKIAAARQNINDLVKAREDYKKTITDQFSDLATPEDGQSVEDFVIAGQKQLADTKKFTALIMKLRAQGLNDELFRDLLAKGTDALPFVENLVAAGPAGLAAVNKLEKDLNAAGATLGDQASKALYNAGIAAGLGLLKGLEAQQAALEKLMDKIGAALVKQLKKTLGIKSPSREMIEVAKFMIKGLTVGLNSNVKVAEDASKDLGNATLVALRKTMGDVSSILTTDPNFNPLVRPILDLTEFEKNARAIGSVMSRNAVVVATSTTKATDASALARDRRLTVEEIEAMRGAPLINYTQNNTSPKPLNTAEVYRQTKNQLSKARGALTPR